MLPRSLARRPFQANSVGCAVQRRRPHWVTASSSVWDECRRFQKAAGRRHLPAALEALLEERHMNLADCRSVRQTKDPEKAFSWRGKLSSSRHVASLTDLRPTWGLALDLPPGP